MKLHCLILLLLPGVLPTAPARAPEAVVVESIVTAKSPIIEWAGHAHEVIDARHIAGPVSIRLENQISKNYVVNDRGAFRPEDDINLYKSEGEQDSPIVVEDNYLMGDPSQGSTDKSKTGSGIMLADCGGAFQVCRQNVVLSAGQVGIGVAGGRFIRVEDNHFAEEILAGHLPAPPTVAPMPPRSNRTPKPDGSFVVQLPWKP